MDIERLVELRGVTKRYPGVVALQDLDLDVHRGAVHAIVGLNGAGKSTLVNLLAGVVQPDEGRIAYPHAGDRETVSLVPQEILFVPGMSIGRNILLGREKKLFMRRRLDTGELRQVAEVLERVGLHFHPETDPSRCSTPQLRLVQVARALLAPGNVMLLDEPTAVLPEADARLLLERVGTLRDQGEAVVYVSHRLGEVLQLADEITVLKDGRKVASFRRGEVDRRGLIDLLTKQRDTVSDEATLQASGDGAVTLVVEGLTGDGFRDVTVQGQSGEVTALVGVKDAGHSQVVESLAGLRPTTAGTAHLNQILLDLSSPTTAVRAGLVLVPADRRTSGIVGQMSVRENTVLSPRTTAKSWGWRARRQERRAARRYIDRFEIKAGESDKVATLSGGNQQKVALARAVEANPTVMLLDEPTQGIDAATKGQVLNLIKAEARRSGRVVLAATSQLEEIPGWADKAIVFREGAVVARLEGADITEANLLHASIG